MHLILIYLRKKDLEDDMTLEDWLEKTAPPPTMIDVDGYSSQLDDADTKNASQSLEEDFQVIRARQKRTRNRVESSQTLESDEEEQKVVPFDDDFDELTPTPPPIRNKVLVANANRTPEPPKKEQVAFSSPISPVKSIQTSVIVPKDELVSIFPLVTVYEHLKNGLNLTNALFPD